MKPPVILTIAGFDPSAGAGTLADVKTMSAFGGYGVAAITSLTFQNTQGVFGAQHQSRQTLAAQLTALFDDFDIAAVKTGMLPAPEIIAEVAHQISAKKILHFVVDPVVRSTSGYDLIDDPTLQVLIEQLFPLASIITPNAAEAERITGIKLTDTETMQQAAEALLKMGAKAVLVKGGDVDGVTATDLLADESGTAIFSTTKIQSSSTHGTGCTLSSALACLLALNYSLRDAIPLAKEYISKAIRHAPGIGKGYGPLQHFPPEF